MTDSVRNTIEEYGPERLQPGDVIVANDPYRTGTHVNDMLFVRPVFHDGADPRLRQPQGPPAGHGRRRPRRVQLHEAHGLRERPRGLAARPVQRRRARARDLEPDLRQRALRRDPLPRHADDLRRPGPRRAAARPRAPSATAPQALRGTIDYVCDANAERIAAGPRRAARRPLGGLGHERLRRRRRRRGVPGAGGDHQARRSPRGRLQRHLAPGPHLHQRHRAGRQDDGRRGGEVPARSARRVHLGPVSQHRHRAARGHGDQRAAARRRGVRLLRAEPGDALRAAARVRRLRGRAAPSAEIAAAPTSTTPSACGPTGRRGSRRPSAAARSARSAPRATATARRRCSPTRPTAWRPRSRRSRPTSRS